eukprot:Lithocolla_globosa_v1_NODE_5627_length_1208_cov_4.353859.p1 type:complete len:237 gc:universal NODE_5627_length_1208_cov_4.353859:771-61(-)
MFSVHKKSQNIINCYGYSENPPSIVLQLADTDLSRLISDQPHLFTPETTLKLSNDIVEGMVAVHDSGIVHRDLKTQNILIKYSPQLMTAMICDFGIARVCSQTNTGIKNQRFFNMFGFSPRYTAPEVFPRYSRSSQNQGIVEDVSPELEMAADVYSFSMILYEMLTRQKPWNNVQNIDTLRNELSKGQRPDLSMVPEKQHFLTPKLTELMKKAWAQNPYERLGFRAIQLNIQYWQK